MVISHFPQRPSQTLAFDRRRAGSPWYRLGGGLGVLDGEF